MVFALVCFALALAVFFDIFIGISIATSSGIAWVFLLVFAVCFDFQLGTRWIYFRYALFRIWRVLLFNDNTLPAEWLPALKT